MSKDEQLPVLSPDPLLEETDRAKTDIGRLSLKRLQEGLENDATPWTARKDMIRMGLTLAGLLEPEDASKRKTIGGLNVEQLRREVEKARTILGSARTIPNGIVTDAEILD